MSSSEEELSEVESEDQGKVIKPLSKEHVQEFNKRVKNRGICYLSRIPPYMKPAKMRHLLEQYGAINRVYLQPEGKQTSIY